MVLKSLILFLFCVCTSLSALDFSLEKNKENVLKELSSHITLEQGKDSLIGYLSLSKDRSIDNATYLYIKYALESFRKKGVRFVLLDLDTPGGEVFSALRIVEEFRKMDAEYGIPIVALVDDWAISAGALLAYSCRFIGAKEQSSMGAAEPVIMSSEGKMESASEKMVSALRVEFAKTAEFYGRNPLIAEAMVDKDMVLVIREGKIISLLNDAQIEDKDRLIISKGKLLTLSGALMQELGVSDFLLPSGYGPLSGEVILKEEPFFNSSMQFIPYSNWKIEFFSFLSHPFVSSFLLMGLMIGLYGSIQNPTLGFSSILALCCLALVLLSTFATQLVGWLELLFCVFGILLLLLDIVLLGFSFLGGVGIFFIVGGLFTMLLPSVAGVSFSYDPTTWGVVFSEWVYRLGLFLSSLVLAFVISGVTSRFLLPRGIFGRRLVLKDKQVLEDKPSFGKPKEGSIVVTFSSFRPFGKVEVEGRIYEAKTEGEFIEQGVKVKIIGFAGDVLVVSKVVL